MESPDDTARAGSLVGPYRLGRLLGRGGMGVVFEARHERIGQRVALKLLAPARRRDASPRAEQRFLTEARALSRVEHPALVRIFDCGEDPGGGPWIAMEYVEGEPLRARLQRLAEQGLRLPLADAISVARRIAAAVVAVHRAGIVHRDLKPDNIMIIPDDERPGGERIKLLDFGIAKLLDADAGLTSEGVVMGTAAYMAPEQCTGTGEVDGNTDVYALGVITYELLAGERPFRGDAVAVMRQHLFTPAPPLAARAPELPADLCALVAEMLAKEPSLRPGIEAVVERLRAAEEGTTEDGPRRAAPWSAERAGTPTIAGTTAAGAGPGVPTIGGTTAADAAAGGTTIEESTAEPSGRAVAKAPIAAPRTPGSSWVRRLAPPLVALACLVAGWAGLRAARPARVAHALPGMAQIPGGRFRMGSSQEEIDAACASLPGGCTPQEMPQLSREKPVREVTVSPFQIDVDEVTNEAYVTFLEVMSKLLDVRDDRDTHEPRFVTERASGLLLIDLHPSGTDIARTPEGGFATRPGRAPFPVVGVTWDGASRYCRHLGKRLPTEAEWELAARGRARRRFPWGVNPPRCDGVVYGRSDARGCPTATPVPDAVGAAPQDVTPEGVRGLGGNVSEWVQDQFALPYYGDCGACVDPVAEQPVPVSDDMRIFRGGSFWGVAWFARATTRSRWKRTEVMDGLGFRCVSR